MEKVFRRVATAERVAAKRKKNYNLRAWKKNLAEEAEENRPAVSAALDSIRESKNAIRDAWKLGANAPRLDVGDRAGQHGALIGSRFRPSAHVHLSVRNKRSAWAGGIYNLNIVVGDRVVLLEGPDKGSIGIISDVDEDMAAVVVKGLNMSNVRMPSDIRTPSDPEAINMELPISIDKIRLVHPIRDAATGETRDVIINQLERTDLIKDRVSGKKEWTRVVPGLNISIPWPKVEEPEPVEHSGDTMRIEAEARTFVPTLLRPPMPPTLINELRNPYSRFRTRHDPEWLASLDAAEEAKRVHQQVTKESMRTPLQELHRAERDAKKKKGKPRLTPEMLERIGEVIARNRERSLHAAGLSDVAAEDPAQLSSTPPQDAAATTQTNPNATA